jgi:hypothetical protein
MAKIIQGRYKELYPDDEKPIVCTLDRLRGEGLTQGMPRVWLTDEVWPDVAENVENDLKGLTFLGGVGTPKCMDIQSR